MNLARRYLTLTLLPVIVAGCTVNKVSVVHTGGGGALAGGAGALKSYASFADVNEDFQIQGMISAGILPLMKNKADARQALLRDAAAGLGVNSLIGFTHLTEQYGGYGMSCAILANTGMQPGANEVDRPRFLVCMLPVSVKTGKTNLANRLETFLTPELRFHLAEKGYYAYRCNSSRVDVTGLATDRAIPAELKEPLGVEPDFVLRCEIEEGGDTTEFRVKTLRMRVSLYDLRQKTPIWEDVQSMVGWKLFDLPDLLIDPEGKWTKNNEELTKGVRQAVEVAAKRQG